MRTALVLPSPAGTATSVDDSRRLSHRNRAIVLGVSVAAFRCTWIAILVVRCVSAAYLGGIASVYFFLSNPVMSYYVSLLGPRASQQLFPMGICSAILAVGHVGKAGTMLACSWRRRDLVFQADPNPTARPKDTPLERAQDQSRTKDGDLLRLRRVRPCFRVLAATASRIWHKLFGWNGFFSVKSDFFDIRLLSREFAEILSQTLQMMSASQLLVRPWVTNLCTVVIIVNCWSTPVVQLFCQHKLHRMKVDHQSTSSNRINERPSRSGPRMSVDFDRAVQSVVALERIWCLSIDLVLDIVMCVAVPAIIVIPYLRQFDISTYDFPMSLLYDDVKFVNLVFEFQHALAVDPIGLCSPSSHIGAFSCAARVFACLSRVLNAPNAQVHGTKKTNEKGRNTSGAKSTTTNAQPELPGTYYGIIRRIRLTVHSKTSHFVFFAWGMIVLSLHLSALRFAAQNVHHRPVGCKQILQPWLTRAPSCSVIEYNCFMRNASSPTDDDLRAFHMESVAVLIFSHCGAAIVPSAIRDFPNLLGFEVYNSTIIKWDHSASFSVTNQKRMSYVQLLRTNMSNLPDGLIAELPPKLLDIEIRGGNLTTLPADLEHLWHPLNVLYMEECGLTSIPEVLTRLQVKYLSLAGNQITSFVAPSPQPIHNRREASFVSLSLAKNPLTELSESQIGNIRSLRFLSLEGTSVDSIPTWIYDAARSGLKVYMTYSRFCSLLDPALVDKRYGADSPVTCVDEDKHTGVPIDVIAEHRPLHSAF